MSHRRLIVVSNRLPVELRQEGDSWHVQAASGGLVSALSGVSSQIKFEWVGWPGLDIPETAQSNATELLQSTHDCTPVFLSDLEIDRFYNGFCNRVLWPLFHYLPSRVDFSLPYWDEYQHVNEKFANALLPLCRNHSLVWIHDYQLFLLPALLKKANPTLKVGFFLHIPFPSSEIYRLLPVREEILKGVLGSDLIGFQTHDHLRHFTSTCLRILGLNVGPSEIWFDQRAIKLGVYPIGINPSRFSHELTEPDALAHLDTLSWAYHSQHLILGVDRLDYTKGLPLKFQAYEQFLEKYPHLRDKTQLIQVAVPSRSNVPEYRELKTEIDEWVGRINGRFGSMSHTPITYLAQSVTFSQLCALYRRANALLVSSVRDGMNLVSHEYVACQKDEDGVLILSEFAGAASLLSQAIIINPWNTASVSDAIYQGLTMPREEKRERQSSNFNQVTTFTSLKWARSFVQDLNSLISTPLPSASSLKLHYVALRREYAKSSPRLLLLDYDGTLTGYVPNPDLAVPSEELLFLLRTLSINPKNKVYLISGRAQDQLEKWFGAIPEMGIAAEHGAFLKPSPASAWQSIVDVTTDWMPVVIPILDDYVKRTPGSFIEIKKLCIVWHYRKVEESFGTWQANELALHLEESLANLPVEVLHGNKIIEVRAQGTGKGVLIDRILAQFHPIPFILCLGDDRTDEDMFTALPPSAWSCRIGSTQTHARFYLEAYTDAIEVLEELSEIS